MDGIRDEHPADIGQGFDARRNVDAVAVEVAALDDHVAEVDADAKLHAVVGPMPAFRSGIASCMSSAQRTAATALANSTSRPSPVVLNAAAMLGDFRIEKLAARRFETFERAFLVRPVSREYPTTSAARIAARRRSSAISPLVCIARVRKTRVPAIESY
jgi:hypothetical protein